MVETGDPMSKCPRSTEAGIGKGFLCRVSFQHSPGFHAGKKSWVLVPAEAGLVSEGLTFSVQRSPLDELLSQLLQHQALRFLGVPKWRLVL